MKYFSLLFLSMFTALSYGQTIEGLPYLNCTSAKVEEHRLTVYHDGNDFTGVVYFDNDTEVEIPCKSQRKEVDGKTITHKCSIDDGRSIIVELFRVGRRMTFYAKVTEAFSTGEVSEDDTYVCKN